MTASLVGRRETLDALERLLADSAVRLVTLTGCPGIGKTSLALALAELHPATRVVDLAPVADSADVLTAIATTLAIEDRGQEPLRTVIAAAIGDRRHLLILDNFEHVIGAAAEITFLLQACAHLQVLVTSRAPLHVAGEHELPVPPLEADAAAALFVERARAARADFSVTDANRAALASICAQLEGIPLALELAAARIKILSAEQIAERLADCFLLLTGGGVERPSRHRTLRAALDWSFRMLDAAEQSLLQRLAVFAGGARIEAVESVCSSTPILDALAQLVDRSLVVVNERAGATRYRLLEPIRQYALERLRAGGEEAAVRTCHAQWFLALAERAAPEFLGSEQSDWYQRLADDLANLRQSMALFLAQADADRSLRLATALWKFCEVRGHAGEGERWLGAALQLDATPTAARSKALHGAANLAFIRGDYERTMALHEENLALRRGASDHRAAAITLFHMASVLRNTGEATRSMALCRESLALFRQIGDLRWCANALNSLGMALIDAQAYGAAREALDEALVLYRRLGGQRGIAVALGNLGDLHRLEADYDRADTRLRQALDILHVMGDARGCGATLESLALVAAARGSPERAAVLFGAADAQRTEVGASLPPADDAYRQPALAAIRLRLGSDVLEAALERGRRLSRAEALVYSRRSADPVQPVAPARPGSTTALTDREREVAALVARGLSNRQIADELVFTKHTADKHIGNILGKLELASRAQLAVWWISRAGQSSYF